MARNLLDYIKEDVNEELHKAGEAKITSRQLEILWIKLRDKEFIERHVKNAYNGSSEESITD